MRLMTSTGILWGTTVSRFLVSSFRSLYCSRFVVNFGERRAESRYFRSWLPRKRAFFVEGHVIFFRLHQTGETRGEGGEEGLWWRGEGGVRRGGNGGETHGEGA